MVVFFYSVIGEYIGNRLLKEGEAIPHNATLKPVEVNEDKIAFFIDNEWVLKDRPNDNYSMGDDE